MGGKQSSSAKDPLAGQRSQAAGVFMQGYQDWLKGGPQVPTFMQGPSSTITPLTSTLKEAIATGMPTNVAALGEAERKRAVETLNRDVYPQILERFGMGGQRFGSTAMESMARTSGDVIRDLTIAQLGKEVDVGEAAAGRRLMASQLAGLPIELQKAAMMYPELLQFILGAMPSQKSSGWNVSPEGVSMAAGAALAAI